MRFADWVRERRQEAGYATQAALADAMAAHGDDPVDPNYVWQLENGRIGTPKQPLLRQLADALMVAESDVLRAAGLITAPALPKGVGEEETPYGGFARAKERRIAEQLRSLSEGQLDYLLDTLDMMHGRPIR